MNSTPTTLSDHPWLSDGVQFWTTYKGFWFHTIEVDGDQWSWLGHPENDLGGDPVVHQGAESPTEAMKAAMAWAEAQ
jgi:hypothetical protein